MPMATRTTETIMKSISSAILLFLSAYLRDFSPRECKSCDNSTCKRQTHYYQSRRIVCQHLFAYFSKVYCFRVVEVSKLAIHSGRKQQRAQACHYYQHEGYARTFSLAILLCRE